MKAKNVKVGLRVQIKSSVECIPVGTLGTVTEVVGDSVCVHWDDDVGGWRCLETNVPNGHGWAVSAADLRKVKE